MAEINCAGCAADYADERQRERGKPANPASANAAIAAIELVRQYGIDVVVRAVDACPKHASWLEKTRRASGERSPS